MFQTLVSHNPDLQQLLEKGYAIAFAPGYLIVRDIPYLNQHLELCTGSIIAKMNMADQHRVVQDNHQIFFAGSAPYNLDGSRIPNLNDNPATLALDENFKDVVVERIFSNKPLKTGAYSDFFEKIEAYVAILSAPAIEKYNDRLVTPYTHRVVEAFEDSVFNYHDTLTSRAEIYDLSAKLKNDTVAIIGLGGTGAYVLDFLVRTPVKEIRAYDLDPFHVHNAFRSPGKCEESEFGQPKAEVYSNRYSGFRKHLSFEAKHIDATSKDELAGVTFAFVCVDKGSSRAGIFELLMSLGIPYIDVGMGLARKGKNPIKGMIRTTYYSPEDAESRVARRLSILADNPNDIYKTNIQIGELNALNAALAVLRYKQLRGFYQEDLGWYHLVLGIEDLILTGFNDAEDEAA